MKLPSRWAMPARHSAGPLELEVDQVERGRVAPAQSIDDRNFQQGEVDAVCTQAARRGAFGQAQRHGCAGRAHRGLARLLAVSRIADRARVCRGGRMQRIQE